MDSETPWGEVEKEEPKGKFKRFFFQLGMGLGMSQMREGMTADAPPPDSMVYVTPDPNNPSDPSLYQPVADPVGDFLTGRMGNGGYIPEFILPGGGQPGASQWVPDADSEDYLSGMTAPDGTTLGAYGGSCPADNHSTGPTYAQPDGTDLMPSKYCVRVKQPGFVFTPALRLGLGYFIEESFALSVISRIQFSSGQGTMAGMLLGLRGEVLLVDSGAKGLSASIFFGGTYGQIQFKVAPDPAPWAISGPFGGHLGTNIRYRFHPNFGIYIGPEVDALLPDFLLHIEVPVGVEAAF